MLECWELSIYATDTETLTEESLQRWTGNRVKGVKNSTSEKDRLKILLGKAWRQDFGQGPPHLTLDSFPLANKINS